MPVCRMSARLFRHVLPLALALLTSGHLTAAFVVVKQSLPAMTVHDFGSISACGRRRSSALRSLIDSASEAHLQASVSNEQDIMPSIDARTIERAFDEADKSKTGKLGIWELDQVLTDLGYSTPDEKNDIFAVLDFSRDGLVSRKEFCENMSGSEEENEFYRRLSRYLQRQSATQQDVEALIGTTRVDSDPVQGVSEVKQTTLAQPQTVSKDSWPGKVGELNTECEFDDLLDAAGETPVLVKAFAPWCRKCAALKAPYSKLARAYGDRAVFVKMSVASAELKPMIKDRLDVKQIPTFQVWKNKKLVDEYVAGKSIPAIPKRVATMLDAHIAFDFQLMDAIAEMDFDSIDIDSSGGISQMEFEMTFSTLGFSIDRIRKAFSRLDENGDGQIAREEFESFCIALDTSGTATGGASRAAQALRGG